MTAAPTTSALGWALDALEALGVPDEHADRLADARRELDLLRRLATMPDHRHRVAILGLLNSDPSRPWSPVEIAEALDLRLGTAAYHVRMLVNARLLKPAHERRVRGAVQHFYVLAGPLGLPVHVDDRMRADAVALVGASTATAVAVQS